MRNIVNCKACGKSAVQYKYGTVCAHCGHGHQRLFTVQVTQPKGKIKSQPIDFTDKPLLNNDSEKNKSTGIQTNLF